MPGTFLFYLYNRSIFLFHFCDTVNTVALRFGDRFHRQSKEGALKRGYNYS